ncbi:MAG TPA: sortase [Patescibacteria group bacterium]|nr:sortase [Patescibacteria group bacterium]
MSKQNPRHKAPKMPFSFRKHILPPMVGIFIMLLVFAALNSELIVAEVRYRLNKRHPVANLVVPAQASPTAVLPKPDPSKPSSITIPAINVNAPVTFEPSVAEWKIQVDLRSGVVHYGPTADPGQNGTVVIVGHSSGLAWAPGDYKWIFTLLNKLKPGDQIQISYQGINYVYQVTDSIVIAPTDMSVLNQTKTPTLSLVTCTPVGTSKSRLVVHAKQISPNPIKAEAKPAPKVSTNNIKTLPGGSDHSTSFWGGVGHWFKSL